MSGKYLRLPWKWSTDPTFKRELTAEAFRTYVFATLWCGKEMTDGWIEQGQALETAEGTPEQRREQWEELVEFGLAAPSTREGRRGRVQEGYELVEFLTEQLPASYWEQKAANNRERQARSRERKKAQPPSVPARTSSSRVTSPQKAPAPTSGGGGLDWNVASELTT